MPVLNQNDVINFLEKKRKASRSPEARLLLSGLILQAKRPLEIIQAEARGRIEGREEMRNLYETGKRERKDE